MPTGIARRITIRVFVPGSIALLLLAAIAAVMVPLRSAVDADLRIGLMDDVVIARLIALDEIKSSVSEARQHMAKALIAGSDERHAQESAATREAMMEADRLIARYHASIADPGERGLFARVELGWNEWKSSREAVLKLSLHDYRAAAALYQVDAPQVGEPVANAIDSLIDHHEHAAAHLTHEGRLAITRAVRLSVALCVAMSALVLALMLATLHRVVRPLERLAQAMRAMGEGALDLVIPGSQRSDEIGAISQALLSIKRLVAHRAREKANQELAVQRRLADQAREEERKRELVIDRISGALAALAKGDFSQARPDLPPEYARISRDFETTLARWQDAHEAVDYLADHDALTGLANRHLARRTVDDLFQSPPPYFAILAADVDRLATVNEVFGHAAGDQTLREVAEILQSVVQPDDLVARVGSDEFAIVQRSAKGPEDTRRLVGSLIEAMSARWNQALDPRAVALALGIATYPQDGASALELKAAVEMALDRARRAGRGQVCYFDEAMDLQARARRRLEGDLDQALARQQFRLDFQPIVNPSDQSVRGYEALLRWHHPELGLISPQEFIPIAEANRAIVPIGAWVLREACTAASGWSEEAFVAVNISAVQLQVPDLPEQVASILRDTGLSPHRLELEITESALILNSEDALGSLQRIRDLGVDISMDDFGTGYSSLSNLQRYPFSKLKIDQSFVARALNDDKARSIIRAVVGLGRSLGLPVLAEGVETEQQCRLVIEEGCTEAQGYLFGRAATPATRDDQGDTARRA